MRFLIPVALVLALAACAPTGRWFDLRNAVPDIASVNTKAPISVLVVDRRPQFLGGGKSPAWIGSMRSGAGIPFETQTRSGAPLGDDITAAVVQAYRNKGGKAAPWTVTAPRTARTIQIDVLRWETDVYLNTRLICDLQLKVLGPDGAVLAETRYAEDSSYSSAFWIDDLERQTQAALRQVLKTLLETPKVRAALAG